MVLAVERGDRETVNRLLDRYGRLLPATVKSPLVAGTGWVEVMPDVLQRARRLAGRG